MESARTVSKMMSIKHVRYALIMVGGLSVAAAATTRSGNNNAGPSGLDGRPAHSVAPATQTVAVTGTPVAVNSSSTASRRMVDMPEPASMVLLGGGLVLLAGVARRGLTRRD